MRRALAGFALAACAGAGWADLYRWVDPETGSVKFSNLPPPWYGDPALERRAPKVEVIRSRPPGGAAAAPEREMPAREAAASTPARDAQAADVARLEARRREIAAELRALWAREPKAGPEVAKRLETYAALAAELDRLDPQGARARHAETEALLRALAHGAAR